MKLGINNDVNPGTKKAVLQLMEGGPSKINRPTSHPANPIHKAAMAAQTPKPASKTPSGEVGEKKPEPASEEEKRPQHEVNKTAVIIIGVVGVVALAIVTLR